MPVFDGADAPAVDEVEVIVFGPGYGECIAVHFGSGKWMIVDSCLAPDKTPAPLAYFTSIGVTPNQVKYIVVTHWHDDHSKGVSKVAAVCTEARVGVSNVLNMKEGREFLAAFAGKITDSANGTSELFSVFTNCKGRLEPLGQNRVVLTGDAETPFRVTALSPSDECWLSAQVEFRKYLPLAGGGSPLNHAPRFKPNNEAVALHISIGELAVLLGSDLETNKEGWSVLAEHQEILKLTKAQLYKVAHHGSKTAECVKVWERLLDEKPLSLLTPFQNGGVRLPNEEDRKRLTARSSSVHTSSAASVKPDMDAKMAQRLSQLGSVPVPVVTGFGAVRARRKLHGAGWQVKYFGHAGRITH